MKNIFFKQGVVILLGVLSAFVSAGESSGPRYQVDSLPNGLQTILWPIPNEGATRTAELRLVIRAGSLQEADGQKGFAHFVEHMAFNDTAKYPKETLYRKLEELGMSIGMHSNAMTTFDQTVYQLTLNDFSDEKLETALDILSQWAMQVRFEQVVVDAEKPVIREEWRSSEPLEKGWQKRYFKATYKNSRYDVRMPIGDMKRVEAASAEGLRAFYQRWYQPDNAAVIVTGDIDVAKVQSLIGKYFSGWKSEHSFTDHAYDLSIESIPSRLLLEDEQVDGSLVILNEFQSYARALTADASFDELYWRAGMDILGQRLTARVQDTGGAVDSFGVYHDQESPNVLGITLAAGLNGGELQTATSLLAAERTRLLEGGVTKQELDNWRKAYLQRNELYTPKAKHLADRAVGFAVYREALMEQGDWNALLAARLPTMTVDAVNAATRRMFAPEPKLVLVHNPAIAVPDEATLTDWLASKPEAAKASPAEGIAEWTLPTEAKGEITAERTLANGIQEWTLSNGMQVYYQHNKEQPGRVFYALSGLGGMNHLEQEASLQARLAFETMEASGLRDVSGPQLSQWMKDESLRQSLSFDFWDKGMTGSGPGAQLDVLLRLLHISLTEARVDPKAWKHHLENNRQEVQQMEKSHTKPWRDQIDAVLFGNDAAYRQLKENELEVKPEIMEGLYRDYFAGAQNYRLALVGDIDEAAARAAVLANIASLPASGEPVRPEALRDFPRITKPVDVEVAGSGERTASVLYKLVIDKQQLPALDHAQLNYLSSWLDAVLMEQLREKDGLIYSAGVRLEGSTVLQKDYALSVELSCDPDKVKTVRTRLGEILTEQAAKGPDSQRLLDWQKEVQADLKKSLEKPYVLTTELMNAHLKGLGIEQLTDIDLRTRVPEPKVLQEALQKMLVEPAVPVWMVWLP